MVMGMSLSNFTMLHVVISLLAIACGIVVLLGMLAGKPFDSLTTTFLVTTILTSATGFFFPSTQLLPSHILGVISLIVLAIALVGYFYYELAGNWRWIYIASATVALYLNVFVAIVQAFLKIPALRAMAPTQTEPPFLILQGAALAVFVILGAYAVKTFHPSLHRRA